MSIFSKPKVVAPTPAANAPTAAVADTTNDINQGTASLITGGTASLAAPKRKASTQKPSLIGGV